MRFVSWLLDKLRPPTDWGTQEIYDLVEFVKGDENILVVGRGAEVRNLTPEDRE